MGDVAIELATGKDHLRYLMDCIWRAESMHDAPNWRPLDDLPGMVSQIDNMYAGVRNERDKLRSRVAVLEKALRDAGRKLLTIEDAVPTAKEANRIIWAALTQEQQP